MNQLTSFSLNLFGTLIHVEMIKIFANMPQLLDLELYQGGPTEHVIDTLPDSQLFPQGLRQLLLSANGIKEDPMPILEKLPHLVLLGLRGYRGQIMSCSAQGFPRLQELYLHYFSTEEWRIEIGAMPRLSHLGLSYFFDLRNLPEGLLQLPSLERLRLESVVQISGDDITLKELQRKGCEVLRYCHSVRVSGNRFAMSVW